MSRARASFRLRTVLAVGLTAAAVAGIGCRGILDVQDPQRFSDESLDDPIILPAVGNGVEGDFHKAMDQIAVFTGLQSDELEDTSTWIDWADLSLGRLRGDWATTGSFSGAQNSLLLARYSAQNAAGRFKRVLGDSAARSPLNVQVESVEGWTNLILGMAFCESPGLPGGPRVPDTEMYKIAITELTEALSLAQAASLPAWVNFNRAGLARANLLAGNYDAALTFAQAVPVGFEKLAVFADNTTAQRNWAAEQLHNNRNRSGGLRSMWFPMVDVTAGALRDPYTNELDRRVAIVHPPGRRGANGTSLHYSIDKYNNLGSDIVLTSKREMNLIEAEVYWRRGDFATAIQRLNVNRTAAGLSPLVNPGTSQGVFGMLLHERFAVLFVEGHRMTDLARFNLVRARLGPNRATKLPLSRNEILDNVNINEGEATCPALS
jgi:hypothetical protein